MVENQKVRKKKGKEEYHTVILRSFRRTAHGTMDISDAVQLTI